jgi:hypothetical protein
MEIKKKKKKKTFSTTSTFSCLCIAINFFGWKKWIINCVF